MVASHRRATALGAALLLALFHLATARLGIDYGKHWDEHFIQRMLTESVSRLDAWPQKYFYGSLYAGMGYLALAPEWIGALPELIAASREIGQSDERVEPDAKISRIQRTLHAKIEEPAFLIRVRTLFALATTVGIAALFVAGTLLGSRPWSGVLAAAVLALSWEFNTHARHIAVDGLLVALVATCLALLARFLAASPEEPRRERWLYLAAGLSGVATGTKFHAALLLMPLLGVLFARAERGQRRRAVQQTARCLGIALAASLAVNPGLLLDTVQLANDWSFAAGDYFRDTDPLYDPYQSPGRGVHLREASSYVITAALSPRPWLGLLLSGVAVSGFVSRFRQDWKVALALGGFVPLYLFVVSRSELIIVRNYLPVLPVLALLVLWGFEALAESGTGRWLALALGVVWCASNATHIVSTALSVRRPHDAVSLVHEVREYIEEHPDERFLISHGLAALALGAGAPFRDLPNVGGIGSVRQPFDCLVYLPAETVAQLPGAARVGYFRAVLGSREVNYDHYPDWIGHGLDQRAYVLEEDKARPLLEALGR